MKFIFTLLSILVLSSGCSHQLRPPNIQNTGGLVLNLPIPLTDPRITTNEPAICATLGLTITRSRGTVEYRNKYIPSIDREFPWPICYSIEETYSCNDAGELVLQSTERKRVLCPRGAFQ